MVYENLRESADDDPPPAAADYDAQIDHRLDILQGGYDYHLVTRDQVWAVYRQARERGWAYHEPPVPLGRKHEAATAVSGVLIDDTVHLAFMRLPPPRVVLHLDWLAKCRGDAAWTHKFLDDTRRRLIGWPSLYWQLRIPAQLRAPQDR